MGEHGAGWFDRWREAEPVRLYGWSVASAVLVAGVSTGLLTERWALAIGGVVAAVLMVGGVALQRREAWAPASVEAALDEQHASSYARGYQAALRTVEEAAAQRGRPLGEELTQELHAVMPQTQPRTALGRCRHVEDGRRCTLPQHPENIDHRLEQERPPE